MWSCFEDLVIRKIMMQSEFNLDARVQIYRFFLNELSLYVGDVINLTPFTVILFFLYCLYRSLLGSPLRPI